MIQLFEGGRFYRGGLISEHGTLSAQEAAKNTIAAGILDAHNTSGSADKLKLRFDALASHDITYVGIIQTARASGLTRFPIPYVLTNCHNSLCAVGGTINEDDHVFGLSAAQKYGGIFVPPHLAVIHAYMREVMSGCGRMILGSDSHTRYGALGTMAIGEGGPELVKQLLGRTYDVDRPQVVGVHLTGKPRNGVGPQDVALAIIGAVFKNGFVNNKVMEFIGSGIHNLPIEFRNGIDVMTTETTCLSSIWETDEQTEEYFVNHKRPQDYRPLAPKGEAYYDAMMEVDLSSIEPMIALPCHPSNVLTIRELIADPSLLGKSAIDLSGKVTSDGRILAGQGLIAGCAGGTYDNLKAAADIVRGHSCGAGEFALSVYPASQPVFAALVRDGAVSDLIDAGAVIRTAFCGPCFGAGDVPANGALSIRHSTRNFPNREGSKPSEGQSAAVALMDARSIAATAINGGILTPADALDVEYSSTDYTYDDTSYRSRVYNGWGKPDTSAELKFGPNITDWPAMQSLSDDMLIQVASLITDPVTTTDELIPSGESSSYRSNPIRLAQLTLSRKDPGYVARAKAAVAGLPDEIKAKLKELNASEKLSVGSVVYAVKPGDGSAREQAASCQRVLGGLANIAVSYATKRYRSNLINWGMIPFTLDGQPPFEVGDWIYIRGIRRAIEKSDEQIQAVVLNGNKSFALQLPVLTADERQIMLDGCLINYYRAK